MHATYHKNLGRYNAAGNNKSWYVQLDVKLDDESWLRLSETWDEQDEPETDGLPPSEVVELISARNESYWISTSREEKRGIIAKLRDLQPEIDDAWARWQIQLLNDRIRRLSVYLIQEPA